MNPYLSVQELLFDWEARLAQHLNAFQHVITLAAQRDTQINTQMERITALASTLKQAELAQRHIDTAIVRIEQDKKNIQDLIVHIERELNLFADLNEDRMTQDQRSRKKL
jgi:septal ring factor EnvC (AmiA/AmiB activator)